MNQLTSKQVNQNKPNTIKKTNKDTIKENKLDKKLNSEENEKIMNSMIAKMSKNVNKNLTNLTLNNNFVNVNNDKKLMETNIFHNLIKKIGEKEKFKVSPFRAGFKEEKDMKEKGDKYEGDLPHFGSSTKKAPLIHQGSISPEYESRNKNKFVPKGSSEEINFDHNNTNSKSGMKSNNKIFTNISNNSINDSHNEDSMFKGKLTKFKL